MAVLFCSILLECTEQYSAAAQITTESSVGNITDCIVSTRLSDLQWMEIVLQVYRTYIL
jgi:hypothetical protein